MDWNAVDLVTFLRRLYPLKFQAYHQLYGADAGKEFVVYKHQDVELEIYIREVHYVVKVIYRPNSRNPLYKNYTWEQAEYLLQFLDRVFKEFGIYDPESPPDRK